MRMAAMTGRRPMADRRFGRHAEQSIDNDAHDTGDDNQRARQNHGEESP